MSTNAIAVYRLDELIPLQDPDLARADNVNLTVGVYAKGTVLGEVTATPGLFKPYSGALLAAPSVAPNVAAPSGAGGPLAAGTYTLAYTDANASGQTLLSPVATTTITVGQQINVMALPALPAGVTAVNWFLSDAAGSPDLRLVATNSGAAFAINAYPPVGAASPPGAVSATANTDGSQVAKMLLKTACTVTAPVAGDTTGVNDVSYGDPNGRTFKSTPAFYRGTFATADLVGLDAGAVTALCGELFRGSLTNGKIVIG